jgi:branched-chain amino acid transport system substrate-binding protein
MWGNGAIAQVSDDVVKIGVLTDMTGVVADPTGAGSVVAARLAAEEFGNKILGKPIQIIFADHQNKPDVGANIARQWFDKDHVDAIADVPNSSVALAIQEVSRDKHRIALFSSPGTTALSNTSCSPYGVQFTYDTFALAKGTAQTIVKDGHKTWFIIKADYAFGHQLQKDATAVIEANGGSVVGSAAHPNSASDFSSPLLQAQNSKAEVIGLADAGNDTTLAIKQANEFGLVAGGQRIAAMLMLLTDVHSLGLDMAQGIYLTTPFYWNLNDETRAWADRFAAAMNGQRPTFLQIGVYDAVRHYLRAIEAAGTDAPDAVMKKMRETKIDSAFTHGAYIRDDGRVIRDMYLAQVKSPSESKAPWDFYKIIRTIPGEELAHPLAESTCNLVKKP